MIFLDFNIIEKSLDLTISEVSLRPELCIVLSFEGGVYSSPISNANQKYPKGILTGKKKYFHNKRI